MKRKNFLPTPDQIAFIKARAADGKHYIKDIAEELRENPKAIAYWCRKNRIETIRKKNGHPNSKYSHLHKDVLTYFLDHTFDETAKHFHLSAGELKSCFTYAYRDKSLTHLRKDTRTKELWTAKEVIQMTKMLGLLKRKDIAIKLGRGHAHHSVKEFWANRGSGETRYINGMSMKWCNELFGIESTEWSLKTKAGPPNYEHIIVPWAYLWELVRYKRNLPPHIKSCVKAMARFQKWLYKGSKPKKIFNQMRAVIHEQLD